MPFSRAVWVIILFPPLLVVWHIIQRIVVGKIPYTIRSSKINHTLGSVIGFLINLIYLSMAGWLIVHFSIPQFAPYVSSSKLIKPLSSISGHYLDNNPVVDSALTNLTITESQSRASSLKIFNEPFTSLQTDDKAKTVLFELVNSERTKAGLKPLVLSKRLSEIGESHAKDMWQRHYFSHKNLEGLSPFDRLKEALIFYVVAGENLAFAPTPAIAHQGLMNSFEHRQNILDPDYGQIGIAAVSGGPGHGIVFVQEFTN